MSVTLTQIANMALDKAGSSHITDYLTDTSANAVKCRLYYPIVLDAVLRSFSWNFASKRLALASAWLTATAYTTDQYVWTNSLLYKCAIAHTSVALFATDLAAVKWTLVTARPSSGFSYAYTLPADYIRFVTPIDSYDEPLDSVDYPWRIEGKQILFDETTCDIRYIYKNETVADYDPLFVQVVIYSLAAELSMAIKQNEKLPAKILEYLTTVLIPQARSIDAQENSTRILQGKTLINSRLVSRLSS